MQLTPAQKARLGAFIIAGTVVFVGAVLTLAGLKTWQRRDTYVVLFSDNVSGLEVNAQVKYQGLRVGRVEAMRISPHDPTAIEVTLALDPGTPLHQGTAAVLDLSGITGLKTVNLVPGDPRAPMISPGSTIPTGQSLVERITGQAEVITSKLEMVVNQLARWTGDENRRRFEALLDSGIRLSDDLDRFLVETREPLVATLAEAQRTGVALAITSDESARLLREIRPEAVATIHSARLAIDEAHRILAAADRESVEKTVRSAQSAMAKLDARLSDQELGRTIEALTGTLAHVSKLLDELDLAVRASREDFVTSLAEVRQATEDLREFSRIIAQDPSVLLRGKENRE